jgi:hypothetical protein
VNKIYFTYSKKEKEGFKSFVPLSTYMEPAESCDELEAEEVVEKVPSLVNFIVEAYRLLKVGGTLKVSAPHFASALAWQSPLTIRGISETSLYFASKDWRKQNNYTEKDLICDFDVVGNFAVEQSSMFRSDEARAFWMQRYNNVVQAVIFVLTKRPLE